MRNAGIISLITLAGALAFSGCQGYTWQLPRASSPPPVELLEDEKGGAPAPIVQAGLQLSPEQRFADIPLPAKAVEDIDRTYVYESPRLQIGRMVYTVKAPVSEIAEFYNREAVAADWKLENVLQAEGAELLFTKPGKRMNVQIQPQGLGRSSLLIINLTPDNAAGM